MGTYEAGWATDFEPAKKEIAVENIRFTGSPVFDENGTYWIPNPGSIKYIGEPSPEIDQNWEDATWGRYFLATDEEARNAFSERYGDDVSWLWNDHAGGYVVGIDMFHTLHCLNRLRKAFYPDYYPENNSYRHRVHRDHCFEQIRQFIMCSGDMTLVPTRYSNFLGHGYVESDVKHTCRAFEPLREWMHERYNGTTAVEPHCPHGTYEDLGTRLCRGAE
ncbi:hypothetical protein F5883DRAFT_606203 [Diaporthe sp. PMI_573]|nr:hypothetical protein F5883DRAFT_606203 [Diaporthaceae sp. PMI_573]